MWRFSYNFVWYGLHCTIVYLSSPFINKASTIKRLGHFNFKNSRFHLHEFTISTSRNHDHKVEIVNSWSWNRNFVNFACWKREFTQLKFWIQEDEIVNSWSWNVPTGPSYQTAYYIWTGVKNNAYGYQHLIKYKYRYIILVTVSKNYFVSQET
jgi:hypothetical protein